jgi:hypothetical protein
MLSTLTPNPNGRRSAHEGQACIAEVGEYEEDSNGWNGSVSFITTTGSVTAMGRCEMLGECDEDEEEGDRC